MHRIGRTARADTKGAAITLINEEDMYKFRNIERLIEKSVEKLPLPEELGEAPEWKDKSPQKKKKRYYGKKKFYNKKKKGGSQAK